MAGAGFLPVFAFCFLPFSVHGHSWGFVWRAFFKGLLILMPRAQLKGKGVAKNCFTTPLPFQEQPRLFAQGMGRPWF